MIQKYCKLTRPSNTHSMHNHENEMYHLPTDSCSSQHFHHRNHHFHHSYHSCPKKIGGKKCEMGLKKSNTLIT